MDIKDAILGKVLTYSSISSYLYGIQWECGLVRMPNEKKLETYGSCSPTLISVQNPMFGDDVSLIYFCHLYAKVLMKEECRFSQRIYAM